MTIKYLNTTRETKRESSKMAHCGIISLKRGLNERIQNEGHGHYFLLRLGSGSLHIFPYLNGSIRFTKPIALLIWHQQADNFLFPKVKSSFQKHHHGTLIAIKEACTRKPLKPFWNRPTRETLSDRRLA